MLITVTEIYLVSIMTVIIFIVSNKITLIKNSKIFRRFSIKVTNEINLAEKVTYQMLHC